MVTFNLLIILKPIRIRTMKIFKALFKIQLIISHKIKLKIIKKYDNFKILKFAKRKEKHYAKAS